MLQAFQAFLAAWREACNSSDYRSVFLVPEGKTYLLMPVTFRGPCRAISITAMVSSLLTIKLSKCADCSALFRVVMSIAPSASDQIKGTLEAPCNRSVWLDRNLQEWITFEGIDRLRVLGGGTLNGNGQHWWINSCKLNKSMVTKKNSQFFPQKKIP